MVFLVLGRLEVLMAEQVKSPAFRTALIGLLGTFLTVCGGLSGALVTSAVTVYQVQRQNQKVTLTSPQGGQTLKVDTGSIFINRQEAAGLDPDTYYVNLEKAFILHRPLPGWDAMQEMTVQEQLAEENATCVTNCDQPVYRIRYGEPIEFESDRSTTVNGHPVPDEILTLIEKLHGPPPWKLPYYSQMVLNVYDKSQLQALGIRTLPDMILQIASFSTGQVDRVVAQENSHFAILQLSSTYAGIRLGGVAATITTNHWILFAEADKAFYSVEITYTPQSGQPVQVWDDLQMYIDQFRVIQ
jgi:hypothetical protein